MRISAPITGYLTNALHDLVARHPRNVTGIKVIRKATGESVTNSTTLQDDDDFYVSLAAGETLAYIMLLHVNGLLAAGFKCGWTFPSGGVTANYSDEIGPLTVNDALQIIVGGTKALAPSGGNNWLILAFGRISCGATPGTFRFQWAQNTANATGTTLNPESMLILFPSTQL